MPTPTPSTTAAPQGPPGSVKFAVLNQRSPAYLGDVWRELDDLYVGGYQLAKNSKAYLPKLSGESDPRYGDRVGCAAYINYMGQIVDFFSSALFSQELTVTEASDADDPTTPGGASDTDFYAQFLTNADLQRNTFAEIEKRAFKTAILKRRALVCVDFPRVGGDLIKSLADEEKAGASRAYIYEMPVEQLIDWDYDDQGNFKWAVIYRQLMRKGSPFAVRGPIDHEFKVWQIQPGGMAAWALYRFTETDRPPEGKDDVLLVDADVTSFPCIPIVEFAVPEGLWVGNKIGLLAKEHYQRRSTLVAAENKSMVAIPYVKRGPEFGGVGGPMPSETQQTPWRGRDPVGTFASKGWVEIGNEDELGFAEPAGGCYALVSGELAGLKDECFRIVHQMAAGIDNGAAALGRSGESKAQDRMAETIILTHFGNKVREHATKVFSVMSQGRGETVVWVAKGLDRFAVDDREIVVAEATAVNAIPIPSVTFKTEYKTMLALKLLPSAPSATQELIRKEIKAGVAAEGALPIAPMDQAKIDATATKAGTPPNAPPAKDAPPGQQVSP